MNPKGVKIIAEAFFKISNSIKAHPLRIVESNNDNATFIPADPSKVEVFKNSPFILGVTIDETKDNGYGSLNFLLGDNEKNNFYFSARYGSNKFNVGLSTKSFDEAQ